MKTAKEIPGHVSETITGVKRKLDSLDSNTYLNLPFAKKQRLLREADQAIVIANVANQKFVVDLSQEEMSRLTSGHKDIDIDELLALKDDLCVPDAKWSSVVHVMRLSDKCTIYHIRKRRAMLDKTMGSIVQTKGNGRQQDLQEVLKWMLKKNGVDPNVPVRIKFAFDGARITMKQKQSQVVGTVEVLSEKSVQQIKSPSNAHQWIIYVGEESNEDLKRELIDALPTIQEIFRDNSEILRIAWTHTLYATCHYWNSLGLYKVHHPKSKYRCTHCLVTSNQLHCWTIEQWPMRSIDDLIKYGAIADQRPSEAARKTFAGQNFGIKASHVLAIPLTRCPPCYLHTVQALVRLLWNQIVYAAEMDQKITEKAVIFLTDSVNMTLPNVKDQKKKKSQ